MSLLFGWAAVFLALQAQPDRQLALTNDVGRYRAPDGSCPIEITISGMGGFHELHLPSTPARVVDDVTGVLFVVPDHLVYSVSPIYGRPGVFVFNCRTGRVRRLVRPRRVERSYPDGTDYFELAWLKDNRIYFYYAADVGRADFTTFREPKNLYVTDLSGSRMRRAR